MARGCKPPRVVGLYNSAVVLLASATIDNTGNLQGEFRFKAITPLFLVAAQTYVLATYYPAGLPGDKVVSTLINGYPLISLGVDSLAVGGVALAFPTVTFADFRMTANMLFVPSTVQSADGDLNFDGKVNAADILLATRIVTGLLTPTANQKIAGDVAPYVGGASLPDNAISGNDLLLITRVAFCFFTL